MEVPSVAIAGAGLSGLCLGQALTRAGVGVNIYERDPSPQARRQGYRLTIDEHGASALKFCLPPHLFDAVLATASPASNVGYFRFTNQNLGEIFKLTFKRDTHRIGRQMIGQVDRATLRTIMLAGLESCVHFGKAASRIEDTPDGAILYFADGSSTQASLVVGADGIHSALREHLLPACPVRDTGSRGIYGKTPLMKGGKSLLPRSLENSGLLAMGDAPGRAFFFATMRFNERPQEILDRLALNREAPVHNDYIMWAMLFPEAQLPSNFTNLEGPSLHALALEGVRKYHPVLRSFVEFAEPDFTIATTLSAATKPAEWPASHATLMGDAVHVMPPTGAHGGNTALRDSACLAQELQKVVTGEQSADQAIAKYQEKMIGYSFKEVEQSVAMLKRNNIRNPVARFVMLRTIPWIRSLTGDSLILE